jgi:hypothetical protein
MQALILFANTGEMKSVSDLKNEIMKVLSSYRGPFLTK